MDAFFKIIDRLFAAIPAEFQKYIRLGMLGVWVVLAGVAALIAFRSGQSSVPQKGEDLYLSNIKEKVYRDRRKREPVDVVLPDLNELFKKEVAPLAVFQSEEKPPRPPESSPAAEPLPMQGPKDEVLFPEKGVRPEPRGAMEAEPSRPRGQPGSPGTGPVHSSTNPGGGPPPLLPLE